MNNCTEFPLIYCDGVNWVSAILPFDVLGKARKGDLLLVDLHKAPEHGKLALIGYGTDNTTIEFYHGQQDAKGRCYLWIGEDIETREQSAGVTYECSY